MVLAYMRVVDLFCGCGGLGLGARRAGFEVALSVDIDPVLTSSHSRNFPEGSLYLRDIASLSSTELLLRSGGQIDGLIGGPPCQGFSEVGLADVQDPRRALLNHFFRLVNEVQPAFFLMENVRGLAFAKNRETLDAALTIVRSSYEIIGPIKFDAADFGAATRRPRVFVIGYNKNHFVHLSADHFMAAKKKPATVRDAIADLANCRFQGYDERGNDLWTYGPGRPLAFARRARSKSRKFTGHRKIAHRPEIAERFAATAPGTIDRIGRHPRLSWTGQCPTIRAGTGAERGSFQAVRPIHPDEPRVITVREAARLQGFPDDFIFHPTAWHSFRMIGNSVPPILSESLLSVIASRIRLEASLVAAE